MPPYVFCTLPLAPRVVVEHALVFQLIVDEAYVDFAPEMALATRLPNTIQLRTLSKAYGLAGLRLGYAIAAPEWVLKADEIRVQFAGSNLSGALIHKVRPNPAPRKPYDRHIRQTYN